jgi:hypothetical protein
MSAKVHKCPVCKGSGKVSEPGNDKAAKFKRKSEAVNKLVNDGYSYREIMALMGFKSTSHVSYYVNPAK